MAWGTCRKRGRVSREIRLSDNRRGLAGLTCGIKCLTGGLSCAVVSAGLNALTFSSGSMDLLGRRPDGRVIYRPYEELAEIIRNRPEHPYARCGSETVAESLVFFKEQVGAAGLAMYDNGLENHFHVTALGTLKPTYLSQATVFNDEVKAAFESRPSIAVLTVEGFRDFHPGLAAGNLARQKVFKGCRIITGSLKFSKAHPARRAPQEWRSIDVGRVLETEEGLAEAAVQISRLSGLADIVGLPAVVGPGRMDVIRRLKEMTGLLIYEVPTLPPSLLGLRVDDALKSRFTSLGGVYIAGDRVVGGEIQGGRLDHVHTQNYGRARLRADSFVLAGGSFFSGGLSSRFDEMSEPVFGLAMEYTAGRGAWSNKKFFHPDGHAFLEYGVKTDEDLRALDSGGQVSGKPVRGRGDSVRVQSHSGSFRRRSGHCHRLSGRVAYSQTGRPVMIDLENISFDHCLKCTACTIYCPVARASSLFPGPKQSGPDTERLRIKNPGLVDESLKYCSNCKRCEIACPSDVKIADIIQAAKYKYLSQKTRIRDFLLSHTDLLGRIATRQAGLVNLINRAAPVKALMSTGIGITSRRTLPRYEEGTFEERFAALGPGQAEYADQAVYFYGCYVNYNDHQLGKDVVRVLNALGVGAALAPQYCCGVPMIANGYIGKAKRNARFNIESLGRTADSAGGAIVSASSTCTFALKHEYRNLLGLDNSAIFDRVQYISQYVNDLLNKGRGPKLKEVKVRAAYHAPCHLERMGGVHDTAALLKKIPGLELVLLHSECCGISGTYGFKNECYQISQDVAAEAVRRIMAAEPDLIVTDCETCKWQFEENTPFEVVHPITLLARAI